jgi:hypothetical protein
LKILKATYGSGDCVIDVTERLQQLVKNGCLSLVVSNHLFTDPCPGKVKTLHFAYELPGSDRFYTQQTNENELLMAPLIGGDRVGIFYTNNSIPSKYLERVLGQLKKAAGEVDIITCPWHPIEGNPFPEVLWTLYHVPHYATITLQILKLLYTAQQFGPYEYVFFLEHDVLYPEGYFDIEPFSEDVLSNTHHIGLCDDGYQTHPTSHGALHLLTMRLPAAIEHFTSSVHRLLTNKDPFFTLEPWNRIWTTRQSSEPTVHINHGNHFSGDFRAFSKDKIEKVHPYWGPAVSWWE